MLRATRALRASAAKVTTGIVGLDVVPNARPVLMRLYEKTLKDLTIMPNDVPYRVDVEKLTKYRMEIVANTESIEEIEKQIGCGQVEELIEQAKSELELIPEYASWRTWDMPRPIPEEDDYSFVFADMEYIEPNSLEYLGLREAAQRKRAEAEERRKQRHARAAPPPPPAAGKPA